MRTAIRILGALTLASTIGASASALAADWPSKPITFVVPFPPGGTSDQAARLVGNELSKSLKQPVVVENKAGANGIIGTQAAQRATPDGYTMLLTGIGSSAINPSLYPKIPYDSLNDFVNVSQFMAGPNVLVVNPQFPAKTLKEFIDYVKANPGKLNYASSANGSSNHLTMEMLKQVAGLDISHVPYKGGAPALTDVIGGQVPMMFINQDAALPYVKAGKLRALGMASEKRNPAYPDVPTFIESGYPGFVAVSWVGLSVPRGTPQPIVNRLHEDVVKALSTPSVKKTLEESGFIIVASSPAEYTDFMQKEIERWGKVIKDGNIRVD